MIQNFEYLIVFTSAPGVLPEQNDRYRIQLWKVNEIKAYKKTKIWGSRECPGTQISWFGVHNVPKYRSLDALSASEIILNNEIRMQQLPSVNLASLFETFSVLINDGSGHLLCIFH